MNRIGFDARMIGHSGIGTYIKSLLAEFGRLGFLKFVTAYGCGLEGSLKAGSGVELVNSGAGIYSLYEQLFFAFNIKKNNVIFHSPHYNAPMFYRGRLIVTIHDLTHLKIPEFLPSGRALVYAKTMLRLAARRSARIITSSNSVKSDIIRMLKVPEEKIVVIPLAAGADFRPVSDEAALQPFRDKYGLPESFVLYAGNMKKHKNLDVLLEAYRSLRAKKKTEAHLVIASSGRTDDSFIGKSDAWGLSGCVKVLPFIPDEEMPLLYNCARMFVFPSLSEGFGLPVLEAMACGVPCAVSRASAVPEVAGDAAVLCDPKSPSEFENAMREIMTDDSLHGSLKRMGLERAGRFSWEKTAGETVNVYNSCSGDFL